MGDITKKYKLDKEESKTITGYASIDEPWKNYYSKEALNITSPDMSAYEYMVYRNQNNLDGNAVSYFNNKFTYEELIERIDSVAKAFTEKGVKKGDIVTMMLPNIPENLISIYALNKIGAVADLVDLRAKDEELIYFVNESNPKMLIVSDLFINNIKQVREKLNVEDIVVASPDLSLPPFIKLIYKLKSKNQNLKDFILFNEFEKKGKQNNKEVITEKNDEAFILHTSGTTGRPKGVIVTNENVNTMTMEYENSGLRFSKGDKFLNQVPPFLAYNVVMATHLPLSLGMEVVMLPEYNPEKFAQNVIKHKVNHVIAGPADWENFLNEKKVIKSDLSNLYTLACGSDKMNNDIKQKVNKKVSEQGCDYKIIEGWGMTEGSAAVCTNLPQCNIPDSVGIPLPKMKICIYKDNEELKYNEEGEICFTGPTVMKAYFKNDEATKELIQKHSDGNMWVHSGDLGRINENGVLFISGRLKRIIVRHDGQKISPFEIEKVIESNENVNKCCVVGIPDEENGRGQMAVANIVLNEGANESILDEIIDLCNLKITSIHLPKKYVLKKDLPLTKVGKVDYRQLEKICIEEHKNKVFKK